jgi:hypothetical protein
VERGKPKVFFTRKEKKLFSIHMCCLPLIFNGIKYIAFFVIHVTTFSHQEYITSRIWL